jgi:hypothetical protein
MVYNQGESEKTKYKGGFEPWELFMHRMRSFI